jgi:hypothetical protein
LSARARARRLGATVLAATVLGAGGAAAQVTQVAPVGADPAAGVRAERPFGEPLHWRNMLAEDRLPRRERPLVSGPLAAPTPPPPRRGTGLRPYASTAAEFRDNVFLTSDDEVSDVVLSVAPGVAYLGLGPNWTVTGDAAVEAAHFVEESDESRVINGLTASLGGSWAVSPTFSVDAFNGYAETRESGEALVPDQLPPLTRTRINVFVATARTRPAERWNASAGYRNTLQFTEAADRSDVVEHVGEVRVDYALGPTLRVGGVYEPGVIDFSEGALEWTQAGRLTTALDLGERVTLDAHAGVVATGADGGRVFADAGGSASVSWRDLVLTAAAGRELLGAVGVEDPVFTSRVTVGALARLRRGLLLDARLENRWLTVLDADDTDVVTTEAEARLSYAVADDLWVWARYRFKRDDPGGDIITANRVLLGVTRDF